jgi:SET domain-containing protein
MRVPLQDPAESERVYVARSPIHGHGLFAARPLRSGELIGRYEGPEVTEDGIYVLWIEDENADNWTGYDGQNEMRFMNHSDSPTAEMDGLDCYALCEIGPDTEITIDYGWNDS